MAAQPTISYIIPDIGTPDMNTYVEVIAPNTAEGSFGTDGLYLNNSTDKVRLECANPSDTNMIVIGPVVVSWKGRLLSTQIFVRKYLPIFPPTEENWSLLKREYRIPIRVFVSGQYSNVDTFYIVKPYSFGDKSKNAERVLGAGTLGVRSRRGAMLVDSMMLGSGTYTVSTADCDPNTVGNQGYLPITILTKGNIVGDNNGTIISVSASNRDGGAGGGGGGGKFCDVSVGTLNGDNGGNGYTGGGKGGVNGTFTVSSSFRANGLSTGKVINNTSGSLNEAEGGTTPDFEAAGGGGGHPFGTSGSGCRFGNSCNPSGGYGGGSGRQDNESGGGGGYYSIGANSTPASQTGGKVVGNNCLVPLAGGSGGAGGNPRGLNVCSGEGGGGGGAISLYGYSISNIQCQAIGADGAQSSNGNGGSGSGGAVILMSKSSLTNVSGVNVSGGSKSPTGGSGRFRHDAMTMQPPIDINFAGSIYRGPTTDTTTIVPRLKGTLIFSSNGKPITLFLKPEGKPWLLYDYFTVPEGKDSKVINFSDITSFPETRYYLVAMQSILDANVLQYTSEPTLIMSQAGANILQIADQPIINSSKSRTLNTIYCSNDMFYDTVKVLNEGVIDLTVFNATFLNGSRDGNQGFSLVSPFQNEFPLTIPKQSAKNFIVRYSSPPIAGTFFTDTLKLINNDPEVGKSLWAIGYTGNRDLAVIGLLDEQNIPVKDTIDFGKVCLASGSVSRTIQLQNKSNYDISVDEVKLSDQSNFTAALKQSGPIPKNTTRAIDLTYNARSRGKVETILTIDVDKCGYKKTIVLKAEGVETKLVPTGTGQFSSVKVGTSSRVTLTFTNIGNAPASLQDFTPLAAPFRIVSTVPTLPAIIPPGDVVTIVCEYTPTKLGDDSATLAAISLLKDGGCIDTARILLAGKGVQSQVVLSSNSIDMGIVARCDTKIDSVRLTNIGAGDLTISKRAIITGTNSGAFSIINQPTPPYILTTNGYVVFIVTFTPALGVSGLNTAILSIETDDPQNPIINIPINATKQLIQVDVPKYIDLGVVPVPSSGDTLITLTNSSNFDANLTRIISTRQDVTVTPSSTSLAASGGSAPFLITFPATSGGIIRDTLKFIFNKPCEDTLICIIEVTGIMADLSITNRINFGNVVSCQQKIDSVSYTNIGKTDLQLLSMDIIGTDANVFSFSSQVNFFVLLKPDSTFKREIIFNPILTTDGVKNAQVVTNALINGININYNTDLVGERRSVLLTAPGEVTFGGIEISSSTTQALTLRNNGVDTIEILEPKLRVNSGEISLIFDPTIFPLTLLPKADVTISVRFAPTTETNQTDTIVFPLSKPCLDERLVIVTGTGLPIVRTVVSLPVDTTVNPAAVGYKIPIRVSLSPASRTLPKVTFTAEFEFDKHIFLPLSVNRGAMTTRIDAATGKRIVTVTDTNQTDVSSSKPILVEIIGNALLGNVVSDSLRWRNFQWGGTSAIIDGLTDGFLQLTICEKGGDRLISDSLLGFGITARPQPVSDNVVLSVATVELGQHSVQVVNTSGQQVFRTDWEMTDTNRSGKWEDIEMEAATLPSGMYLAVLRTPTKVKTTQIMIVH